MILEEKVDQLMEDMAAVKSALKYNGMGLIPSFEQHCNQDRTFREEYYRFKRWVLVVFGILIGSGVLGISAWGILG